MVNGEYGKAIVNREFLAFSAVCSIITHQSLLITHFASSFLLPAFCLLITHCSSLILIPHSSSFYYFCSMKYTQTTLDKIEKLIGEAGYIVRYERGSFQSGFCILEDKKVVVLNKFLQLEGRINTLIDLIPQLKIEEEALSPESKKIFLDIMGKYRATREEEDRGA